MISKSIILVTATVEIIKNYVKSKLCCCCLIFRTLHPCVRISDVRLLNVQTDLLEMTENTENVSPLQRWP